MKILEIFIYYIILKNRGITILVSGDTEGQGSGDQGSKCGGWITLPFMIGTILGLSIAFFGSILNLIVFLIEEFNIKSIAAAQISNIFNGCISMSPVVAAILADSFFGNIPVIMASTLISLLDIFLLTIIASLDYLRPRPCETGSVLCQSPSTFQLDILYAALTLVATGSAGTRTTLVSVGANQYEKPKDQGSFFNWYFLTASAGTIISATAIIYTQDNAGWKLGFGLCAAANLISFIIFISGKRLYKHDKPMGSPFTSLLRVLVSAIAKRKAVISSKDEVYYHGGLGEKDDTSAVMPSKSFRFLNRAALKTEGESGEINNMWRHCSVQEVEDFKSVLRILPLCLAIVLVGIPSGIQTSLMVLQALVTDRGLGPHFKVPAGSVQVIAVIFSCIFIILNNWFIYPMYQRLTNKPLTPLQKMGIGQVFIILNMAISAVVEAKRLKTVESEDLMSVAWLFPPLVIVGIGDAFQLPASAELFYGALPESLRNTAISLTSLAIGISFYLTTAVIDVIQRTTEWLPNDINHGRVDNVYWVLVIGGVLNLGYFLVCSWFYSYKTLRDERVYTPPRRN